MAEVNVFELTNMALKNLDNPTAKKSVKESVKRSSKKSVKENKQPVKISYKKLKLESVKSFKESDEGDTDYTPDDEVVLVIDTEMEEVPETEEDAVAAAKELVGDTVCKCSVCGANYICTCDTIEEDVDGDVTMVAEEEVCPICGEEAPQIVVGEIIADETASDDEDKADDDEEVEVDETEVDETEGEETEGEDDFDFSDFEVEEDEEVEEGCNKKRPAKKEAMRRPMRNTRKEGVRRPMNRTRRTESARPSVKRPMRKTRTMENKNVHTPMARPSVKRTSRTAMESRRPMRRPTTNRQVANTYNFNESALNKLFTSFATENYSNVKSVRFTNGSMNRGKLTLEGVVTTVRGTRRNIKLVAEGMKNIRAGKVMLQAREIGPFTESAVKTKNRVPFVIECAVRGKNITPTSMKYAFTTTNSGLKESKGKKNTYKVYGSVK